MGNYRDCHSTFRNHKNCILLLLGITGIKFIILEIVKIQFFMWGIVGTAILSLLGIIGIAILLLLGIIGIALFLLPLDEPLLIKINPNQHKTKESIETYFFQFGSAPPPNLRGCSCQANFSFKIPHPHLHLSFFKFKNTSGRS